MPLRALAILCLATSGWAFSFGLGSQVCTHWLKHAGSSDTVIGLNHACYYLGVALTSLFVPRALRRLGPMTTVWGMIGSALSLLVFPWGGGPAGWFLLRLLNGAASALALIPLETIVSRQSPAAQRTRNFGFYAVALTLGGAAGIGVGLHLCRPGHLLPFIVGGLVPLGSALLLAWGVCRRIPVEANSPRTHINLVRNYLSFGTAWGQGFLEGGMLAFLSLYLLTRGLSQDAVGALMAVTMVGVILFQVPVSWLADRYGTLAVLLGCYVATIVSLGAVPLLGNSWLLVAMLFVFGACSGALYPLGLSLLGDNTTDHDLARAYSWYLAMECVGSQMGSAAMGRARDLWGESAMFPVGLAALVLVLGSWTFVRRRRMPTPALEEARRAA